MGNTQKLKKIKITEEVISCINEEFDYQSTLQGSGRADAIEHGVSGQLVSLKYYLDEAFTNWTKYAGDEKSLESLRKIAAIALRALIEYGCPRRIK